MKYFSNYLEYNYSSNQQVKQIHIINQGWAENLCWKWAYYTKSSYIV